MPFWKGFVTKRSKQNVTKVVSLYKIEWRYTHSSYRVSIYMVIVEKVNWAWYICNSVLICTVKVQAFAKVKLYQCYSTHVYLKVICTKFQPLCTIKWWCAHKTPEKWPNQNFSLVTSRIFCDNSNILIRLILNTLNKRYYEVL